MPFHVGVNQERSEEVTVEYFKFSIYCLSLIIDITNEMTDQA